MQQDCPMTPTPDELRRAENGDPWAVLLVGLLRAVPSNNGLHLTGELAGLQTEFGFGGDSPEPPAGEPDR